MYFGSIWLEFFPTYNPSQLFSRAATKIMKIINFIILIQEFAYVLQISEIFWYLTPIVHIFKNSLVVILSYFMFYREHCAKRRI